MNSIEQWNFFSHFLLQPRNIVIVIIVPHTLLLSYINIFVYGWIVLYFTTCLALICFYTIIIFYVFNNNVMKKENVFFLCWICEEKKQSKIFFWLMIFFSKRIDRKISSEKFVKKNFFFQVVTLRNFKISSKILKINWPNLYAKKKITAKNPN